MPNIEPFVRWAGGKTWLIPYMSELIRNIQIEHYHEPFLGGGAVFFSTEHAKKSYLSDANPQLINSYNHRMQSGRDHKRWCFQKAVGGISWANGWFAS